MIPIEFAYEAPESLEEAIRLLREDGEDAKLLAGGHSLLPMMKLRFAAPTLLIDLRRVAGLHGVQRENGSWRIGALVPHAELEDTPELGVVSRAAGKIADRQVRNRGTIGGSLAHADPSSDLPTVLLTCDGSVAVQGADGQRVVEARDLFRGYMQTAIGPAEILTEVRMPALDGYGFAYEKFTRRAEDWAMAAVCAVVKETDGVCEDVRIGLTAMGAVPLRATAVEEALRGGPLNADTIASASELAAEGTTPGGDVNATPDYKRHLARVLCRRALQEAAGVE